MLITAHIHAALRAMRKPNDKLDYPLTWIMKNEAMNVVRVGTGTRKRSDFVARNICTGNVLVLMPLDTEAYQANAKKCEDRAEEMPPALRRELLAAARQWRKLASRSGKRGEEGLSERPQ